MFCHDDDCAQCDFLCVDLLRGPLGGDGGCGDAVWRVWRLDGRLQSVDLARVVLGKEDEDCYCWADPARGVSRSAVDDEW